MKIATPTAAQKLLKYPFGAIQLLLENQKTVELNIKVDGYIGDPKFRILSAFTKALQKALVDKAKAGIKGTMRLAVTAPVQVKNGLSKIGAILTDPFVPKNKTEEEFTGDAPDA